MSFKIMFQSTLLTTDTEYRILFENSPQPMWVFDVETLHFLAVNQAATTLYGFTAQEFLAMTLGQIHTGDDIQALLALQRNADGSLPADRTWRHRKRDGSILFAEIKFGKASFAGREACLALMHDVTNRVLAEQALSSSEAKLRTLMETTSAVIFFYRHERFEFVNKAIERITGFTREEIAQMSLLDIVHPDFRELVSTRARARLRGEDVPSRYELKIVTKDGGFRWMDLSVAVVLIDGERATLGTAVDITEQHTMQNMLRDSEEKFRTLTETTSAAIFFYHGEKFRYVNHAMERITGYARTELQNMRFTELVHPDHREMVRQRAIARQQGKEVASRYELKILTKAGATCWLEVAPSIVMLSNQKTLMGTAVDITERKKVEEELRRSEQLTHRILEAVPGGILEVSNDGSILRANPEAQHFFGLAEEELLRMNIADFAGKQLWEDGTRVPYDDLPIVKCLRTREDQPPVTMGVRRPDGGISWAVFTAIPLLDVASGETSGAVLTFLDISGRKHTEDALRASEERYRKFFEDDLTGDFIASADGHVLACNPAFAAIFGFSSIEAAINCDLNAVFTGSYSFAATTETLREKKKIEYFEAVGKRNDGRPLYVIENLIGLFDDSGSLIGVRGYVFDSTAHKLLEQQVQEAQKLESIGRLAGGIAHDFNNLLGIILGYSERLLRSQPAASPVAGDVNAIHTAAQRGANLVRQLLTFARKTSVEFDDVNVNTIVDELLRLLRETIPRNIALRVDLDSRLPVIVADANQIHQAVLNLCVNARDAMPDGGVLTLRTRHVNGTDMRQRFAEAEADAYVCISVSDTGIGMGEDVRARIFDPFFSTKEPGRGTGLGLAVVHGIVKTHHGFVDVASEHGKGATFSLYFPMRLPQVPPMVQKNQEQVIPGGTETILVVEDEDLLLELVQSLLEFKGYTVLTASNGKMAVDVYAHHQKEIALVLTDLGLPELGGWEACQQMRVINPKLKIIVASGYMDPAAKQEMVDGGINAFVQKPYLATEISAKVREILDDASSS